MLGDSFKIPTASSHDIIRTCSSYKRRMEEYSILERSLADMTFKYAAADLARKGQLIAEGEEIKLPEIGSVRQLKEPVPHAGLANLD